MWGVTALWQESVDTLTPISSEQNVEQGDVFNYGSNAALQAFSINSSFFNVSCSIYNTNVNCNLKDVMPQLLLLNNKLLAQYDFTSLVRHFKFFRINNYDIKIPNVIDVRTREYMQNSDIFFSIIEENYIKTDNKKLYLSKRYIIFSKIVIYIY